MRAAALSPSPGSPSVRVGASRRGRAAQRGAARAGAGLIAAWLLALALPAQETVTVATHYFYWYRWPDRHFDQEGVPGPEGHFHHFPEPEQVDYESPDWHSENFRQMASCDIDAALPVYWGAPGAYQRPDLEFSRKGLTAMATALGRLNENGEPAVKLGLFYDTSTLANDTRGVEPRGERADLTTEPGRDLFCRTVVEYFEAIPERHWARHRGKVLVVLYASAFASKWDASLGKHLRRAFAARFPGQDVCLAADASWREIGQDLTTSWGAALWGPRLFPGVAQIGPGYDDSPVPGRTTPFREREDGDFYSRSWQEAILHRPELVLLETWNEMHEGTELCPTLELGDRYVRLTRQWIARLRSGEPVGDLLVLQHPDVRRRPRLDWGAEADGAAEVYCDYSSPDPSRLGLREIAHEDGVFERQNGALHVPAVPSGYGYLYFQVSDHFTFDQRRDFILEVTAGVDASFEVEYDSWDRNAPGLGAYTVTVPARRVRRSGVIRTTFRLRDARFANRQNSASDFRLRIPGHAVAIRRIALRPAR